MPVDTRTNFPSPCGRGPRGGVKLPSRAALAICGALAQLLAPATQAAPPPALPPQIDDTNLTLQNTTLILHRPNAPDLRSPQLQGAILHLQFGGELRTLRIASTETDREDSDLLHHQLQLQDKTGQWRPACAPNERGETWALPVALPPGHPGREADITIACASDPVAQCLRLGYKPWARGRHGENLEPYHAACVNMLRADYAGTGGPPKLPAIPIRFHDDAIHWRIDPKAARDKSWAFEAGWSPEGAVCLARVRWDKLGTVESILKASTRLAAGCTEEVAQGRGALILSVLRVKTGDGR